MAAVLQHCSGGVSLRLMWCVVILGVVTLLVCGNTVWCCHYCVALPFGLPCGISLVVVVVRCCN